MIKRILSIILALGAAAALAVNACALTPDFATVSDAYVVIDAHTGQILVEKNMNQKKYPASITKILTAGLAAEKGGMDSKITLEKETIYEYIKWGDSTHVALDVGETVTVRDMMYGTLIVSANDCANALAQYVAGDVNAFPEIMNAKAAELGLTSTHFTNAHGLPDNDHYTTAYDMAMITRWALQFSDFKDAFCATEYTMAETNLTKRNAWGTYHHMLVRSAYYYDGAIGGKLGWTSQANHTIVTLAERDGVSLICVAMDCTGKFEKYTDTAALFDFCFDNYRKITIPASALTSFNVPISSDGGKTSTGTVNVSASSDLSILLTDGQSLRDISISYDLPDYFTSSDIGELSCRVTDKQGDLLAELPLEYSVSSGAPAPIEEVKSDGMPLILRVLLVIVCVLLGLVALLFIARFFIRLYYRNKRKKRRAAARRAASAAGYRSTSNRPVRF